MIWLLPWEDRNDVRHVHFVVYLLLAINIAVFAHRFFDHAGAVAVMRAYALWPNDPQWYQYLTHTFLHGDLWLEAPHWATCCSCGCSATTSRTCWATPVS